MEQMRGNVNCLEPSLILRDVSHPAEPARRIPAFRSSKLAWAHLEGHVLRESEGKAWALVASEIVDHVDLESGEALFRFRCDVVAGRASAQGLYEAYVAKTDQASREAHRLGWYRNEPHPVAGGFYRKTAAMNSDGILMIVGDWLKTAFLPDQEESEATVTVVERGADGPTSSSMRLLGRRRWGIRPARSQEEREVRVRLKREAKWSHEEQIYYRVFRRSVSAIRRSQHRPADASTRRPSSSDYALLRQVLPPNSRLKLADWLNLRTETHL